MPAGACSNHRRDARALLVGGESQLPLGRRSLTRVEVAFDDEGRGVPEELDDLLIANGRSGDHAMVEREGPESGALRRHDRRRPTGAEPVLPGQCFEVGPQRVALDVADDDGLARERGGAARTHGRTDGDPVDRCVVVPGQTRRGSKK